MPKQRLSQAKLQRYLVALQGLIAAVEDARKRYRHCSVLRVGRLSGLSRYIKELLSLPADANYGPFEVQLKRRLVRVQHRLHGLPGTEKLHECALARQLPGVYREAIEQYDEVVHALLRALGDVNIAKNHQHQVPMRTTQDLLA